MEQTTKEQELNIEVLNEKVKLLESECKSLENLIKKYSEEIDEKESYLKTLLSKISKVWVG